MHKSLKIIHLSDLHCDTTKEWGDSFSQVAELLNREIDQDTVVVLTGDLVDSPTDKNFDTLLASIKGVLEQSKVKTPLGFICVPGNHDLFTKGNRGLSVGDRAWRRAKSFFNIPHETPYSRFEKKLELLSLTRTQEVGAGCHPPFRDARHRLITEYGVAMFLLDSNGADDRFFAEGNVDTDQIRKDEILLEGLAGRPLSNCKKLALLHHHPISIHNGKPSLSTGIEDAACDLTNKFTLLNVLSSHGIDIVLHGHKHKSTKYSFDPNVLPVDRSFSVSGCGTSCAPRESGSYEIKIYTITSIHVRGQSFTALPRDSFAQGGPPFVLISPEKARRKSRHEGYTGASVYTQNHLAGSSKTKELLLFREGRVTAEIAFSGLKAREINGGHSASLREIIAADGGRIYAANAVFDSRRVAYQDSSENWNPLQINRPRGYGPRVNEYVELEATPQHGSTADTLRIQYQQRGGFAVNEYAFNELYTRSIADRTEYCTIYSQIPVTSLELCITFPEALFPPPKSFVLKAYERDAFAKPSDGEQDIQNLQLHDEETNFLKAHNHLRVWQLSKTVSLHVPDPQPNMVYAIHWDVPKDVVGRPNQDADGIIKALSQSRPSRVEGRQREFFKALEKQIRNIFGSALKIFVYLPVNRNDQKVLELVHPPHAIADKDKPPTLLPGRGIAGAAYLLRFPVYYNHGFRSEDNQYVEDVIPGLSPKAVIGVPVTHPGYWKTASINGVEERVVFVITIVSEDPESMIYVDGTEARPGQVEPGPNRDAIEKMFENMGMIIAEELRANAWITAGGSVPKKRGRRMSRVVNQDRTSEDRNDH